MLGDAIILLLALAVIAQARFLVLCIVMLFRRGDAGALSDGKIDTPPVAIQIATYREAPVLPGLLNSILALDWPRDAMIVQILDDSAGADARATAEIVQQFAGSQVRIEYLNRGSRAGFKAGALNYGLEAARGFDLIAYFDADCYPRPDFLRRMVPRLADGRVAAVQARWEYPNGPLSPLTIVQQAAFEYLFRYEFGVRDWLRSPVFYMGSAAVWRRQAMAQLGGWRESPFTAEDVDLGCRAANRGWKVLYEPAVLADNYAIEEILPFRAQQRRWARAVAQAGLDAARGRVTAPGSIAARLVEITALLPHSTILTTPTIALLIACQTLLGGEQRPWVDYSQWVFVFLVLSAPSILALVLAIRYFHPRHWRAQTRLLLMAGPAAAATMTSFLFGLADLLLAHRAEFIATPKAGQVAVAGESRRRWLSMHYGPLVFDAIASLVLLTGCGVALRRGIWNAAIISLTLGAAYAGSLIQSVAATRRHRVRLAASAAVSRD